MESLKDIAMCQTFHMSEKQIEALPKTIQLEREYKKQIYEIEHLDSDSSLYAFYLKCLGELIYYNNIPFILPNLPQEIIDDFDAVHITHENQVNLITTKFIQEKFPELWSFLLSLGTTNIVLTNWYYLLTGVNIDILIKVYGECNYNFFCESNILKFDNINFLFEHYSNNLSKNLNTREILNLVYLDSPRNGFFIFHNIFVKLNNRTRYLYEKIGINSYEFTGLKHKLQTFKYDTNFVEKDEKKLIDFFTETLMKNRMEKTKIENNFLSFNFFDFHEQISRSTINKSYIDKTLLEILCTEYNKVDLVEKKRKRYHYSDVCKKTKC